MKIENLYQTQTQLAIENFAFDYALMPNRFIRAIAIIKAASARANLALDQLEKAKAEAIWQTAMQVADGEHADAFPIDVLQTGSGTSTNMNVNEVIATLASHSTGLTIHPNDDVNCGQSSNDVIPSAIHVSSVIACQQQLFPALRHLETTIEKKIDALGPLVKTGRTHLMDAMPIECRQELSGWNAQLTHVRERLTDTTVRLCQLAIGGTAVGTGINTHKAFGAKVTQILTEQLDISFSVTNNHFAALSSQDNALELSGQLNTLTAALMKISNDIRWMNSGPNSGLGEIHLAKLQAGSSIMPGKVNPVIAEAVAMACAQVTGMHTATTIAAQSGNFQLNVMLPLIAYNLLTSIQLLAKSCVHLADKVIANMTYNTQQIEGKLSQNPILVTALNHRIGYEKGAEIAQKAIREARSIIDVAAEMTDLSKQELVALLDPAQMV